MHFTILIVTRFCDVKKLELFSVYIKILVPYFVMLTSIDAVFRAKN